MLKIANFCLLFVFGLLSVACTSYQKKQDNAAVSDLIMCKNPRSEICTLEYDPVCSRLKDGSIKTDATACISCSDFEVTAYMMGSCESTAAD